MKDRLMNTIAPALALLFCALLLAVALPGASGVEAASLYVDAAALDAYDGGFTYQGVLTDNGVPASGDYDFRFQVLADGGLVGATYEAAKIAVQDGHFSVLVAITGPGIWNGQRRQLRVEARATGETDYVELGPAATIQPVPYAFHARQAGQAVKAGSADTLSNVGLTVVQVGTYNMIESDGLTDVQFAAKANGRMEVTRSSLHNARYLYVPVSVPSQVIGFDQKLAAMRFCYSGAANDVVGVLAGVHAAGVLQTTDMSSNWLLQQNYETALSQADHCVTVTATNPQPVTGSLWVRFAVTVSPVALSFGEISLTFVSE